jgi:pimeloyl-ACP methyl ester carboxylesterase
MDGLRHLSTELWLFLLLVSLFALVVLANIALEFIARWRSPPVGEFLNIEDVRLHYIIRGDPEAPPLVMFHGNATMLEDFIISGLVDATAKNFRVICFDRPGFGHSSRPRTTNWSPQRQAELFCAALTRLGVDQTLVLGHSWGTLVALAMATKNRARVKGLVLISGYYFPTWRFDVWFASIAAIPVIGDILRYTVSPISTLLALPVGAKTVFAPTPVPDVVKKEYPRLMLARPSQLRAVGEDSAFMLPFVAALTATYSRINCPTAIIAGRDDQIVDSEQASRLQKAMPQAMVSVVPNLGHMVHYFVADQIARTAEAIKSEDAIPAPKRRIGLG